MDDVRRNAQERAARPSTLPVGSSFESERQKQKAALVRQIDELDGSRICSTYNTKGKKYCPTAKQIPENKLYAACCDTLEISDFDEDIFQSEIQQITVPAPNRLEFIFLGGTTKTVKWQDRSRSESWTDEMRKQAGRISKERRWLSCP